MSGPLAPAAGEGLLAVLGDGCRAAARAARLLSSVAGMRLEEADFRRAGLASADNGRLRRALDAFVERGWCENNGSRWATTARMPTDLASFLDGAAAMRSVLGPVTQARAVVTMPGPGSCLGAALPAAGSATAALEDTREAFLDIAARARSSLCVMTPFLNPAGLAWAEELFMATPAPCRQLVVRASPEIRSLLSRDADRLRALSVGVLDYRIPLGEAHYETFHAKVVIADDLLAYVGSSNMLEYERRSMELGVILEGQAVQAVAALARAVRAVACPLDPTRLTA